MKIIQILPPQHDSTFQGSLIGLGDDGVVYISVGNRWRQWIKSDEVEEWEESVEEIKE